MSGRTTSVNLVKRTLRDVAEVAGVSYRTVSNVINNHRYVSAATREKVERAISEVGYQPNTVARSLRLGRTGAIGLAVPTLRSSYFSELAADVIAAAEDRGVVVVIEQTNGSPARELDALTGPRRTMTDGLLFIPLGVEAADVTDIRIDFPMVVLGESVFEGTVDHVSMDNRLAAHLATEHLISLGRRNIIALGAQEGDAPVPTGLRLEGYKEALAKHGIAYRSEYVMGAGQWQRADGAEATRQLLAHGLDFNAVFALNDEVAIGAMRVLQEVGRSVPGDVAVIGLDDIDDAQYVSPSLTTVDAGRREIARVAVDRLLDRIGHSDKAPQPQDIRPGCRVVLRESA